MPEMLGQILGARYEILNEIGSGATAHVYRARQLNVNREVAIKVLRPDLDVTEEASQRFDREANTIATLRHPHILKLFDYGRQGKYIYLVMELMPGGSLNELVHKGPFPLNFLGRVLWQICSALDYAHSQGIVHRDLKPQNVLLDERRNASLTDFGIAKLLSGNTTLTQAGNIIGTPSYMAPEQWTGDAIDSRADLYSLGIMLYEMLTGQLPFKGDSIISLMHQHVYEMPPSIRELRPDLPPGVELVVNRALAKDRDDRYQTAPIFFEELKSAMNGRAAQPAQPARPSTIVLATPVPHRPPAQAAPELGDARTDPRGIPQVWVPAGCFEMGSNPAQDKAANLNEQPQHPVCLSKGFWIDQYIVTNAAFHQFVIESGYSEQRYWTAEGWQWRQGVGGPNTYEGFTDPRQPRVGISWFAADAYARWRGGRLPTEAEWEYAARGPQSLIYPWGNTWNYMLANVTNAKSEQVLPVGSIEAGKSWVGAYDMAGCVYEWVADWYDFNYYQQGITDDPTGPLTGKLRVARGGSWWDSFSNARTAFRHFDYPGAQGRYIGFRIITPG